MARKRVGTLETGLTASGDVEARPREGVLSDDGRAATAGGSGRGGEREVSRGGEVSRGAGWGVLGGASGGALGGASGGASGGATQSPTRPPERATRTKPVYAGVKRPPPTSIAGVNATPSGNPLHRRPVLSDGETGEHLTQFDFDARKAVAVQLLALGVTRSQLRDALRAQGYQVSTAIAANIYADVMQDWLAEVAEFSPTARAAQIQRLNADLARYRRDNRWQAVVQTEALLARIQGTLAPEQVEHRVLAAVVVREAVAEVVSSLTDEELDALAAGVDSPALPG